MDPSPFSPTPFARTHPSTVCAAFTAEIAPSKGGFRLSCTDLESTQKLTEVGAE